MTQLVNKWAVQIIGIWISELLSTVVGGLYQDSHWFWEVLKLDIGLFFYLNEMKEAKGHRATDMLRQWNNDSTTILK